MTTMDHVRRIAALRADEMEMAANVCSIDSGPCHCPTCGVARAMLHGKLKGKGWPEEDLHRVGIRPADLGSCSYPYLASVVVDGREVYRIEQAVQEVLHEDVIHDVEQQLRRPM